MSSWSPRKTSRSALADRFCREVNTNLVELDPVDRLCFGLVVGHEREFGYFSLDELQNIRGPLGHQVDRDLYFKPKPVSQCH
jgi:hypothetical protein